ncbi:MAG: protein-L-isoaspartate(D-aspartate) O-methyltransferase [Planctomycetota bacterium]|jgi:protein-L-isoaspartate(D-aspartate) O-methyltransferase
MAADCPKSAKRRQYTYILALLLLMLFSVIVAIKISNSAVTFTSDNPEPNQAPADSNETAKKNQVKPARPDHSHPAFRERTKERKRMVAGQIRSRGIRDPNTLKALETVPRHSFVRSSNLKRAYGDHPLPIGLGQTISQPYIVGYMTEYLELGREFKILEIGTGSGYQAAVCAEIVREVYTIEIVKELAKSAKGRLKKLGYGNVFVKTADGFFGWEEKGPFDAIIITCAAGFIPPPLIEQLKPNGKMILPLGSPFGAQTLVMVTKNIKGEVRSKSLLPVRFVPMVGHIKKAEK